MATKMLCFCALLAVVVASVLSAAEGKTHHAAAAPAPAPAVDCSTVILNMADCLSFVSNGSTDTKPEKTCCDGLKTVLSTNAECLCEAFKNSAQLGIVLNITKAISLPTACKIKAPAASNCGLSLTGGAPGISPSGAVSPSVAVTPTSSSGANGNGPALSPHSSAHGLSTSFGSLIAGLFLVIVSCF